MEEKRGVKRRLMQDERAIANLLVVLIGILFYMALANFWVIRDRIGALLGILMPFIVGFAIAYLLNTPVKFFDERIFGKRKHHRGLAVLTVYLIAAGLLVLLLNFVLPQVGQSVMTLAGNMSLYLANLSELVQQLINEYHIDSESLNELVLSYQDIMKQASDMIVNTAPQIVSIGMAVGNGVVAAITALISSVYMLLGEKRLVRQIKKLVFALFPTQRAERFLHICRHANSIFVGFINGKLLDSAIIGVLCFILNLIVQIPFALLVAVVIGVTNIIPFFGPIIGAVPCVMILLVIDPWAALRFVVLVVALQQFDGNILGPKILGDSTGLSALWVLVAIVVGGGLFGFPGMILGVPTFAVIYALLRDWINGRLARKKIDEEGRPLPEQTPPDKSEES